HLVDMAVALVAGRCFEVEAQEGLGVGRTQVEPPVAAVDREAVEALLVHVGEHARDPFDDGARIVDLGVALARLRVAVERTEPGCFSSIAFATRAVVSEPETGWARSSTRNTRSASPSNARPTSARRSSTRACRSFRFSGWMGSAGWFGNEPSRSP